MDIFALTLFHQSKSGQKRTRKTHFLTLHSEDSNLHTIKKKDMYWRASACESSYLELIDLSYLSFSQWSQEKILFFGGWNCDTLLGGIGLTYPLTTNHLYIRSTLRKFPKDNTQKKMVCFSYIRWLHTNVWEK